MFRDDTAHCPTCEAALEQLGDRKLCGGCGSVLIGTAQLAALMDELSPDDRRPVEQRIFSKDIAGATCPCCATKMTRGWIHDTALEHCPTHGVWLSKAGFGELLETHAKLYNMRTVDETPLLYLVAIPIFGLLAMPLHLGLQPFAKRRRLRKYLARTTPQKAKS